jgi:protoheme IX farnesyltransferase
MIRAYVTLFRLKLSLLNGVSALAGYFMFPHHSEIMPALDAFTSVSLLAAGGSALNQVLERDLDARMQRSRMRPVPQRVLTRAGASAAGVFAILLGFALLGYIGSAATVLLGAAALVWYLAVYTPLKTNTTLALPLGALCGAFPPLIGWSLAGGLSGDYRIITLAGLLFLWQIPHFWLFQRRHAEDYRRAGIPLFHTEGAIAGNNPFFWLWIAALCAGSMLLPAFGLIARPGAFCYILFPLSIVFFSLFRSGQLLFPCINCFPLLVTLLLVIQKQS